MPETTLPLIKHYTPSAALIYRQQEASTPQENTISQAAFLSAAMALSQKLPNHRYAINLCQDRSLFLLSFVAALLRGTTNLLPPNRQQKTVKDTALSYPDCFVITDNNQSYQGPAAFQVDTLDINNQTAKTTISESPQINAEHIAAITFTSGSTGKPSANKKHWRTLVGTAERLNERFIDENTLPSIIATVPSQHMYGLEMTIMMALHGRCCLAAGQPFYPQDIATTLIAVPQPRLLVTTPAHLRVLQGADISMPQIHSIISATAPLAKTLATDCEKLFQAPIKEIYGCTEAGSAATRRTNVNDDWLLLEGMKLHKHGSKIEISGSHLNHKVELQDHLEILDNNRFRFLGRANDILNVAGKRASLEEINQNLLAINGVKDGIIFVPENTNNMPSRPAALVVSELSKREILAQLSQAIDPVFLPRPLRKVLSIPRNETGKCQRSTLEQLLLQESRSANTSE